MDASIWAGIETIRHHRNAADVAAGVVGEYDRRVRRVLDITRQNIDVGVVMYGAMKGGEKGPTHSFDDVRAELCEAAVNVLVALASMSGDPARVFATRLAELAEEAAGSAAGATT